MLIDLNRKDTDFQTLGFGRGEVDKLIMKYGGEEERPELEFAEELMLEHNYIVLYFDNPLDWQVAVEKFGLKKARPLLKIKNETTGIGRVVKGSEWLKRIN